MGEDAGLLRRKIRDDVHSPPIIEPITDGMKSKLTSQLRRVAKDKLYELFSKVPQTRKMAGCLFESRGQGLFQDGLITDGLALSKVES